MRKLFFTLAAFQILLSLSSFRAEAAEPIKLLYFYTPTCHKCMDIKDKVLPVIEERFGKELTIEYKDVSEPKNYLLLFSLKKDRGADEKSVFPVLYAGGKFLDGRDVSKLSADNITLFLRNALDLNVVAVSTTGASDIEKYFAKFSVLAILFAGLIDGINPCSFTVMVFFVSFLFVQKYDKKSIMVTGAAFMLAVFVTYVLIGLGLFGSLYAIKGFSKAVKWINAGVGAFSITLGLVSVYDAFKFRKDSSGEGMILRLPKYVKDRIHRTIGDGYRQKSAGVKHLAALAATALSVGFLVSIFESVCTGQLYLPTIVFMIKTAAHKITAVLYLLLYNISFMVPLFIIFILAMAGASSQAFTAFMRRHLFLIKVLMACIFIVLGASLVHAMESNSGAVATVEARKNDPYFYDFGIVKEGDVLKHKFYFKNELKEEVNITQVNTSCACTASKVDMKKVAPGRKVPVEIQFDTAGYPGVRTRYIYVHTDSKTNPITIFEIRADIQKK